MVPIDVDVVYDSDGNGDFKRSLNLLSETTQNKPGKTLAQVVLKIVPILLVLGEWALVFGCVIVQKPVDAAINTTIFCDVMFLS